MNDQLIASIRNHPNYDEHSHSALIEVIEKTKYTPEQLKIMQHDPVVWESLVRGMLSAINISQGDFNSESEAHKFRLQQAEELMQKSWNFLSKRAQDTEIARVELRAA
jgi:hypothetical protein